MSPEALERRRIRVIKKLNDPEYVKKMSYDTESRKIDNVKWFKGEKP